jgi:hypothetical protein
VVIIQVNPIKPINYITVRAKGVVTQVTSYDVLVRGANLYPLGVILDFWEEILYYQPRW